ncbi:MAG: hypothetical protein WCA36_15925 [Pseudolabrys sp.]
MSADRNGFRQEVLACLGKDKGVVALQQCIASHFSDLEVYRENDDLVIRHGGRFLIVRRAGADKFRTEIMVGAPSTNDVDSGGGIERDVDGMFDEIAAFGEV